MRFKKKFDGVVIGVIICSVVFLGYQYFMVHENEVILLEENAYDAQQMDDQMHYGENASSVEAYTQFVRNNNPKDRADYDIAAFTHLANALEDLSEKKTTAISQAKIKTLQQQIDRYENSSPQQKPAQLKAMFEAANNAIRDTDIEQDKKLKEALRKLQEDTEAIDPNSNDLMRKEQAYHQQAAVILKSLDSEL